MRVLNIVPAMLIPSLSHRIMVNLHGTAILRSSSSRRYNRLGVPQAALNSIKDLVPPPNPSTLLTEEQLQAKAGMVSSVLNVVEDVA